MESVRNIFIYSGLILLLTLSNTTSFAVDNMWSVSFNAGTSNPTDDFDLIVNDDGCALDLSFEYLPFDYLGTRISYGNRDFQSEPTLFPSGNITIDTLSIYAEAYYRFPRWSRVFALLGSTFYSAKNQEVLGLGDDEKDISWSGGVGIDFYPIPNWAIRAQVIYFSAEIGNHYYRCSWIEPTIGLAFSF